MRGLGSIWRVLVTTFTVAVVVHAYRTKKRSGTYYNVPYDFTMPTLGRFRDRMWNPEDRRIFTPSVFGVGWSVNFYEVGRRTGLVQPPREDEAP